ncbi:MAG: bacillithiol biosynthesis deacetylase BshB1 [Planctomycetes bacterium]|nr:bacillithiol biosynthesis deacetylase BshB1 [Planctomycetota bacterium]
MVEVLAIGAHPDDIELRIGGLLASLRRQGVEFTLVHLTRGEAGTRGSPEQRKLEAAAAAELLGARQATILDLGDGRLEDSAASRQELIPIIRKERPALILAPWVEDDHPDHAAAGKLARSAWYLAGISRSAPTSLPAHRARAIWHYPSHLMPRPTCCVALLKEDVDIQMASIRCYKSQFYDPDSTEPPTRISDPSFLDGVKARLRYLGSLINAEYAAPLVLHGPLPVPNLAALLR